jgi:hypothetical protein
VAHERRPAGRYYENRIELLSQGDIFEDVPLAYPMPAASITVEEDESTDTARAFLSGPLDFGPAMLITPTCSLRSQPSGQGYAHHVRTLVPLRSVEELLDLGILDPARRGLADKRDSLINYMYLPADSEFGIVESLALLYMPITLHHEMISDNRVTQLTFDATAQLQKKLAWHSTSVLLERSEFQPPMD